MNSKLLWIWSPFFTFILTILYMEIMFIYILRNPQNKEFVLLIIHHILLFIVLYDIFKVTFTDPGTPNYKYMEDDPLESWRKICKYCTQRKPLRCHHCHKCGKCISRMDNHQIFLNNCVGQNNYKYFFCLLFYMSIFFAFYFCVYLTTIIRTPPNGWIDTYFIIFIVPLNLFYLIAISIYSGFHIKLVMNNQTALEYIEKKEEHYDNGLISNFNELLGPGCWLNPF